MIPLLTNIIGLVARGPNAKARAGGIFGLLSFGAAPLIEQLHNGLIRGAGTSVEEMGYAIGVATFGWLAGYVITWLSPANKE